MEISSLLFRTEAIFWKQHCQIEDLGDALIITAPDNPTWNWGNYLLLDSAPAASDVKRWTQLIESKIFKNRESRYYLITWQHGLIDDDALTAFDEFGLEKTDGEVLRLGRLSKPLHWNDDIEVVEIDGDDPLWPEIVQLDIDSFLEQNRSPGYAAYATKRMADHKSLVSKGIAQWFIARLNGELVGAVGLYPGQNLYRYQEVAVKKEYRRRGIASTMIYEVAQRAFEANPHFDQVIVAISDGEAKSVYKALGFELDSLSYALSGRKQVHDTATDSSEP